MEPRSMAKGAKKGREKTVKVGSKVVCVDDRFPPDILVYYNSLPLKDRVYVVRGMGVGISHKGEPGVDIVTGKQIGRAHV